MRHKLALRTAIGAPHNTVATRRAPLVRQFRRVSKRSARYVVSRHRRPRDELAVIVVQLAHLAQLRRA